jgi:glutaminyl-peptide cyclotransferase
MRENKQHIMKHPRTIGVLFILVFLFASTIVLTMLSNSSKPPEPAPTYSYTVIKTYPHDQNAFTEGLFYADGYLYESTGLYGSSTLRKVELETGKVLQETVLSDLFFGEGCTIIDKSVIQLTWQSHVGFVYDKETFQVQGNFTYATEGWGITFNGTCLIMSDGTDNLYYLNPETYQPIGQVQVHDANSSITNINELEYINGDVYANIWQTQKIAIINPQTGQVKAWINLSGLGNAVSLDANDVLNGIAYDQQNDRLFVTGKNWSQLYEIKLVPSK